VRHSCASALIAEGAPVTEVQHRLGHASPDHAKVYSHWFRGTETGIAGRLALIIASPETGKKWATNGQKVRRLMAVRRENP